MIQYFEPFESSLSKLSLTSINIASALTLVIKLVKQFCQLLGSGELEIIKGAHYFLHS